MHAPVQWQISTPVWVWCVTALLLLLTSLILARYSFVLFVIVALMFYLYCRRRVARSLFAQGVLRFEQGCWIYAAADGEERRVSLGRVWPNGAWITLRFTQEAPGANQSMEVTVWKSRVSESAWRALGMLVAEYAVMAGGARERA